MLPRGRCRLSAARAGPGRETEGQRGQSQESNRTELSPAGWMTAQVDCAGRKTEPDGGQCAASQCAPRPDVHPERNGRSSAAAEHRGSAQARCSTGARRRASSGTLRSTQLRSLHLHDEPRPGRPRTSQSCTAIMARLMMSAAVPCMGALMRCARRTAAAAVAARIVGQVQPAPEHRSRRIPARAPSRGLVHVALHARVALEVEVHVALRGAALDAELAGESERRHAVDQPEVDRLGGAALSA